MKRIIPDMLNPTKLIFGVHGVPPDTLMGTTPIPIPANTTTNFDFTNFQANNGLIPAVLSIYIDNKGVGSGILTFTFASGQVIKFPASSQGYLNVLQPNPFVVSIANAAAAVVPTFMLLDFQIPQLIWSA